MSEPPPTNPQPPPLLPFPSVHRDYRKGNWTLQETLTLITAKKLDDERRSKPTTSAATSSSKPRELRWKWVENYCWAHSCFRSQNQCNDKWDNLLRDYKKIRHYQSKSAAAGASSDSLPSYWSMDRQQRKYHNLPSNMSVEVFQALDEVIQRKFQQPLEVLAPPPLPPPVSEIDAPANSEGRESTETESSDDEEGESKKMRRIGASIKRSALKIAETMRKCEEKKEKRHKQVMEYEQRCLQLQQTRHELNSQGLSALLMSLSNLSSAIQSSMLPH